MIRRPPRSTRTDTLFPTRRSSDLLLRNPPLQSMSKKYRSIVSTREGAELSYVDFDQFEVGIMAALSGDQPLAALYAAGDMYELFAESHFGLTGNWKAPDRHRGV